MAQTGDGCLWIATDKGLIQFDGTDFRAYDPSNTPALAGGAPLDLATDDAGDLWVMSQNRSLAVFTDGGLQPGLPRLSDEVISIYRSPAGPLLVGAHGGLFRIARRALEPVSFTPQTVVPLVLSITQSADGAIWLGTRDTGLWSIRGGRLAMFPHDLPDKKIDRLLTAANGDLWIGTDSGLVRWTGSSVTQSGIPEALRRAQGVALANDRQGNVWAASAAGLFRITLAANQEPLQARISDRAATAIFEDRQGDLWVASGDGLDHYHRRTFINYDLPGTPGAEHGGTVYIDVHGATWFAPADGGLCRFDAGKRDAHCDASLAGDVIYSIHGDASGIWLGRQRGGLTRLDFEGRHMRTFTTDEGLVANTVYTVYRSSDGSVWAGALNNGLSRFSGGLLTTYSDAAGKPLEAIRAIAESPAGTMWFATGRGLVSMARNQWHVYTGRDGLPPGSVNCLFTDNAGVLWLCSGKGMLYMAGGRIVTPSDVPELLREEVLNAVQDNTGWLWLITTSRVLRVWRASLLSSRVGEADLHEYGVGDGLPRSAGARRDRSVAADRAGRIWLSTGSGLVAVDPALLPPSVPVPARIQTVAADGITLDLTQPLRVPAGTSSLLFAYTGISLADADKVRFRYRLDGVDSAWSEAATGHEIRYNNVHPGAYTFRVLAAKRGAPWNGPEAAISFEVQPWFWQTLWFRLFAFAAVILMSGALYRSRVRRVQEHMHLRFEERLAERTRIAQELHDTLLQGFLSASMQLHVAMDHLPAGSPAQSRFENVLDLMRQVIDEGRNAVRGLRATGKGEWRLEDLFARVPEEINVRDGPDLRVVVEGRPCQLVPELRDEVYRIGREALLNAFRHSHATNIELEMQYSPHQFRLTVRDNGIGISADVLASGLEGHWGLVGMRERAGKAGGHLNVWSAVSGGTEVQLSVPARCAYGVRRGRSSPRWFARLARGRQSPTDES